MVWRDVVSFCTRDTSVSICLIHRFSRLENTEYSKKYVSAVMRGLLYDGDEHTISTGWTWKSLDALLLRSANFYEAKCFKGILYTDDLAAFANVRS